MSGPSPPNAPRQAFVNKFTNVAHQVAILQRPGPRYFSRRTMPPAAPPPPCHRIGRQCLALPVTLRVSNDLASASDGDHEATWLLGHTERISFGPLRRHRDQLFCRATLQVPCKYLSADGETARCEAHGFRGRLARSRPRRQRRQLPGDRFLIVERGRLMERPLPIPPATGRRLAVLNHNPCATAPCETSDHTRGAACCRDLMVEIMCDRRWTRQELLIRSRQPPYLCKVTRPSDEALEAEMISACSYLGADGVACTLHGRRRADGRQAKPTLCHRWPRPTKEETLHRGCVFAR